MQSPEKSCHQLSFAVHPPAWTRLVWADKLASTVWMRAPLAPPSLSLSTLALALPRSPSLTRLRALSLSLSPSVCLALFRALSLSLSLCLSLSVCLSVCLSLSHTHLLVGKVWGKAATVSDDRV